MTSSGIGSAEIVVAPLILSTYALMATALAGRATVDLSIGPLHRLHQRDADPTSAPPGSSRRRSRSSLMRSSPASLYQIVFGLIVIWVRVQPIIVSLSGYLALSGINLVILPRPGGSAPEWMSGWGAGTIDLFPVHHHGGGRDHRLAHLLATPFYGHLRLMGSDERAAYTSGVQDRRRAHRGACRVAVCSPDLALPVVYGA